RIEKGVEQCLLRDAEVAQETQHRLEGDLRRGRLPVLATFNQQRASRIVFLVEERVVAQSPPGRVPAVDYDMLGYANRSRQREPLAPLARHRQRRARLRHRVQIEQMIDAVVQGPERPRAPELVAFPRAVEYIGRPQPV